MFSVIGRFIRLASFFSETDAPLFSSVDGSLVFCPMFMMVSGMSCCFIST